MIIFCESEIEIISSSSFFGIIFSVSGDWLSQFTLLTARIVFRLYCR
jgi:hypothetical protein